MGCNAMLCDCDVELISRMHTRLGFDGGRDVQAPRQRKPSREYRPRMGPRLAQARNTPKVSLRTNLTFAPAEIDRPVVRQSRAKRGQCCECEDIGRSVSVSIALGTASRTPARQMGDEARLARPVLAHRVNP